MYRFEQYGSVCSFDVFAIVRSSVSLCLLNGHRARAANVAGINGLKLRTVLQ